MSLVQGNLAGYGSGAMSLTDLKDFTFNRGANYSRPQNVNHCLYVSRALNFYPNLKPDFLP